MFSEKTKKIIELNNQLQEYKRKEKERQQKKENMKVIIIVSLIGFVLVGALFHSQLKLVRHCEKTFETTFQVNQCIKNG